MDRLVAAGTALLVLGALGYATGVLYDYPWRAFSVTALMVGITLIAIRRADAGVIG